ncbi:Aste57867_9623 [Aphanomyces stellatus]|uniref:Aste57867_9623 protein n=1 Tax=Aphanomyces stellatus TaxID=120398 RepID=A0A485KNF3_9STRA|nr:hypothetical protein As57867_009585 [Aphanomyces stellatus]VFT86502.1 Aste57867_9623 [Aphanomyces stellatus]
MEEAAFICKKTKVTLDTHLNVPNPCENTHPEDAASECFDSTHEEHAYRDATNAPSYCSETNNGDTDNKYFLATTAPTDDTSPAPAAADETPYRDSCDHHPDDAAYDCEGYDDYDDSNRGRRTLHLEYWTRSDECKERKWDHLDELDAKLDVSREDHIFGTTLLGRTSYMEPNMFPYETPAGIEHWTLWSRLDLNHYDVQDYVEKWIDTNAPHIRAWNYDDNPERSINIFHVHVYLQVDDKDTVLRGRAVDSFEH